MWHLLLTCSAVAVYSLILMNTLCYHVCGISSEPSCKGSYRIKMYWKWSMCFAKPLCLSETYWRAYVKHIQQYMLTVHFDSLKVSISRFTENEQCALRNLYAWAKHIQQHMLTVDFDSLKFSILNEMVTIWKNSCFLKPFNCVVRRSGVWRSLYFLRFLQCVFQKSSALPWHRLYWVAKVQSKTWAVCLGIACIQFVKLMIQSTSFYLIGNCITIMRDDEIGFHIQHCIAFSRRRQDAWTRIYVKLMKAYKFVCQQLPSLYSIARVRPESRELWKIRVSGAWIWRSIMSIWIPLPVCARKARLWLWWVLMRESYLPSAFVVATGIFGGGMGTGVSLDAGSSV